MLRDSTKCIKDLFFFKLFYVQEQAINGVFALYKNKKLAMLRKMLILLNDDEIWEKNYVLSYTTYTKYEC